MTRKKYLWTSTNDNTPTSNRLPAGVHNVSVKDSANTVVTKNIFLGEGERRERKSKREKERKEKERKFDSKYLLAFCNLPN
jgi:hypothetical protein